MSELRYPYADHPAPGDTRQVADGVYWLTMPMPGALSHINLYLLEDRDGWWVVDTGLSIAETEDWWRRVFATELGGRPVKGVICTHMHPDHVGQSKMITDQYRCPLYMTRAEYYQARAFSNSNSSHHSSWLGKEFYVRAGMPRSYVDELANAWGKRRNQGMSMPEMPSGYRRLEHGDVLTIGAHDWRVLVGSGHSPEHACLYCAALKVLISGESDTAGDHLQRQRLSHGAAGQSAQGVDGVPRPVSGNPGRHPGAAGPQPALPWRPQAAAGPHRPIMRTACWPSRSTACSRPPPGTCCPCCSPANWTRAR